MALRAFLLAVLVLSTLLLGVARAEPRTAIFGATRARPSIPVAECGAPRALRLARFEDGSARLECGRRVLVRVSVPG